METNIENNIIVGQTMAFLVLGWTSILHIFTVRSRKSILRSSLRSNPSLPISALIMFVVFFGLAIIPGVNSIFGMTQISLTHWLIVIGLTIIPTLFAEYGKFWDNYKLHNLEKNRVSQQKI